MSTVFCGTNAAAQELQKNVPSTSKAVQEVVHPTEEETRSQESTMASSDQETRSETEEAMPPPKLDSTTTQQVECESSDQESVTPTTCQGSSMADSDQDKMRIDPKSNIPRSISSTSMATLSRSTSSMVLNATPTGKSSQMTEAIRSTSMMTHETPTSSKSSQNGWSEAIRWTPRAPSIVSTGGSNDGTTNDEAIGFSWGLPWTKRAEGNADVEDVRVGHKTERLAAKGPVLTSTPTTVTSTIQSRPGAWGDSVSAMPLTPSSAAPLTPMTPATPGTRPRRHPPTAKLVLTISKEEVKLRHDRAIYVELFQKIGFEVFIKGCARRNKLIVGFETTEVANKALEMQESIGYRLEKYVDVKKTLFPPKASPKTPVFYCALRDLVLRSQRSIKSEQIGIILQGSKVLVNTIRGRRARLVTRTACGQGTEDLGWVSLKSAVGESPKKEKEGPTRRIPLLRPLRMTIDSDAEGEPDYTPRSFDTQDGTSVNKTMFPSDLPVGGGNDQGKAYIDFASTQPPTHFVFTPDVLV